MAIPIFRKNLSFGFKYALQAFTFMNPEHEVLDTRPPRGGIKVVDLSQTPLHGASASPLHLRILDALKGDGAGILSQDELLKRTEDYSPSEVELALRDLSLRGLVRVLWRAPFRFMAFLTERGRDNDVYGAPPLIAPS